MTTRQGGQPRRDDGFRTGMANGARVTGKAPAQAGDGCAPTGGARFDSCRR
ncbi:MAG TPA: hypothetical protein VGE02_08360 [Gemmatimonadales bacterium]